MPKPPFKKPSFFKSGVLRFQNLDHPLTLSNGYYRCTLNCNGKCDVHTKQIQSETLERAFSRYAAKFAVDKKETSRILDKIMRANLMDILLGVEEMIGVEERVFENTVEAMKKDFENKKKLDEEDFKISTEALTKMTQAEYPTMLLAYMLGVLSALASPEREAELGRIFSFITKKVYLSDDGKIISVEFERWGWYILNTIGKHILNYLQKIRSFKIPIVNEKDEILNLPVAQAALYFGFGNTGEAMGAEMNMMYGLMKYMRNSMQLAMGSIDPDKTNVAVLGLFEMMRNDPALAMVIKMTNAMDLKINNLTGLEEN